MDKVILIPSMILGLIMVSIYAYRCWRNQYEFRNAVMINAVFQASGIVCGACLIVGIIYEPLKILMTGVDIYIFISGLAVSAVSIQGFKRDAIKSTEPGEVE